MHTRDDEAASRRTGGVLGLLCAAQFIVVLDFSIVNVALEPIGRDLRMEPNALQWVVSAYALAFGGLLLLGGRAADMFGRRRMLLAGLAIFGAGSALGGVAQSGGVLIAARALQGIGAAAVSPAALSLVTTAFTEGRGRNRALAVWSAVGASGIAAGVVAGGALVEVASWRWVLLVNLPLCVLLGAGALWRVREATDDTEPIDHLDAPGALLSAIGVAALVFGLTRAERSGLVAPGVLAPLAVAAVLLVLFVRVERRARRPLVPLRLFALRTLRGANAASLLAAAAFAAMFFVLSLHLREELRYSALETGLAFLPSGLLNVVVSTVVGARTIARFGAKAVLVIGLVLLGAGLVWLGLTVEDGGYLRSVLPGTLLMGAGMGLAHPAFTIAGVAKVGEDDQGSASGLVTTTQQIGSALGLALLVPIASASGPGTALLAGVGLAALGVAVTAATLSSADLKAS